MRRARSQLNKLTQQQAGNFGGNNAPQNPYAFGHEVDEIQRRLDALQYQQPDINSNQGYQNQFNPNHGFPQPVQSAGFQQPPQNMVPQHQGFQNVTPYATPQNHGFQPSTPAMNPAMESGQNFGSGQFAAQQPVMPQPIVQPTQNTASPQLDTIKSALEQMSSKLHSINSANASSSNQQNSVLQQTEILKQHYNHINAEIQGLKSVIAGIPSSIAPDNNLEIIQETLSANYRAIMQQLEGSQNQQIDNSVFSSALEASHKDLSKQIVDIKQSIDSSLNTPNHYAKTLEVSHDDITKRLDDMHNALQTSIAAPDIYVNEIQNNHNELLQQVSQLQHVVENLEANKSEPSHTDLSSVEMRLEEITRAVVALSLEDGSVNNLERIEARVSDIAKTLDNYSANNMQSQPVSDNSGFDKLEEKLSDIVTLMGASAPDFSSMESQIGVLTEKLENFTSASTSAPLTNAENNALLQRMDDLVEQISASQTAENNNSSNDSIAYQLEQISTAIDKLSVPAEQSINADTITNEVVMDQLQQIAGAIDQLSQPSADSMPAGQFASIEQQLSEISSQLNSNQLGIVSGGSEISFEPITSRLSGIEEQLGANRDITIELATKAAEDAVKMSVQAMPSMDNGSLGSMSEVLAQLNQHVETNNSTNIEAFGAVTQTLDLMVQRLASIESSLSGYDGASQSISAPAMQAPDMQAPVEQEQAQQNFVEAESASYIEQEADAPASNPNEIEETRSPASDLVKAARLSAAKELETAPVETHQPLNMRMDQVVNEPLVETVAEQTSNENLEALAEQAYHKDEPTLPEVQTPAMAMDTLPEVTPHSDIQSGPDVALEPGSGGPDLAALVRQANERRKNNKGADVESSGTDFIAAARRAAQAAAQEAGAVEEEIEEKQSKSLFASLPELFAKRKKVIVMAAAAALFVALAVPLASQFFGGNNNEVAVLDNSVALEETVSQDNQQASVFGSEPPVKVVEEVDNSASPVASMPQSTPSETNTVEPQELQDNVNLASVNLDANPQPANFINTDGLDFASPELKQAVQNGEPEALFEIGRLYTNGIGTEKDLLKASEWYERAANMGFAPAQYIIGNFNEKGLGIDKNPQAAAEWYKQAAKGGNIIAMHNLAVLTATPNALTVEPDMAEAFKWFSNAADYGVRDSQVNAGIFHTKGFGTEVNLVEAYKWFSIAAKAGDKDAGNKRDVIANAIQPDQLEIAKALVADWKPLEVVKAANEVAVNEAWKSPQAVASASVKVDKNIIAQTQSLLAKVGFNAGVADGIMGQKTRNAIAAFQAKSGLPVNGKIDGEFLKALKAVAI